MNYYLEFKAKPSEDLAPEIIISQAFSLCHLEIVRLKSNVIGVSFPQADKSLGDVMRIHGSQSELELIAAKCSSLLDYCRMTPCREVPSDCSWRLVKRIQPLMSAAKIRRLMKRGSITEQEATERLAMPSELSYPYLRLRSSSSNQNFRIFVSQIPTDVPREAPKYSSYGLGGAVPWF